MKDKYLYFILGVLIVGNVIVGYGNVKAYREDHIADVGKMVMKNVLPVNEDKKVVVKSTKVMMGVSAYSSVEGCDDKECIMANGKRAEVGYVACSRKYRLGTRMKIEGKIYVCGDRLSKKFDSRVDVFSGWGQEGYERARAWGVRSLEVEIIN